MKNIPWWLKICAKIILSRLPVNYGCWKRLSMFEHGDMEDPVRAMGTFLLHAKTAGLLPFPETNDFSLLEIGPGDSISTAIIGKALGASRAFLVDSKPFATEDMNVYVEMAKYLAKHGYAPPQVLVNMRFADLLRRCNAEYLTDGISSLGKIPSGSIDYCFSNAVLEHIPKTEFYHMARELARLVKEKGVCVHRVDLKDHLGGGLNSLRFPERLWEGQFFRRSGFYTNRIRYFEMLRIFKEVGFDCVTTCMVTWKRLPISRNALDEKFKSCSDEDLLISGFDVVLRK